MPTKRTNSISQSSQRCSITGRCFFPGITNAPSIQLTTARPPVPPMHIFMVDMTIGSAYCYVEGWLGSSSPASGQRGPGFSLESRWGRQLRIYTVFFSGKVVEAGSLLTHFILQSYRILGYLANLLSMKQKEGNCLRHAWRIAKLCIWDGPPGDTAFSSELQLNLYP